MPKEPTQFKPLGIRTTHKQQPISVKFPSDADAVLRDKEKISDRSDYIRVPVLCQLHADGLIDIDGESASLIEAEVSKRVEAAIAHLIPRIAIKDRAIAEKAFKKLINNLAEI